MNGKYLIGALFIIFLCDFSFSQNLNYPPRHQGKMLGAGDIYSNTDKLDCGENSVIITSTCIANDDSNSDPYCFSQTVSFLKNSMEAVNYSYTYGSLGATFVYEAACLQNSREFYVELGSSSLGSCKTCEWYDFFSDSGVYIGSSEWMKSKTSFNRKILARNIERKLLHSNRIRDINVTTIFH